MLEIAVLICALSAFDHCDATVAHKMILAQHIDDGTPCHVLGRRLMDLYKIEPRDDEGTIIKCDKAP